MWPFRKRGEARTQVTQSDPDFLRKLGIYDFASSVTGVPVTVDAALGVPAISAAVGFLSNTVASLPLGLYRENAGGREKIERGPLPSLLSKAPNPTWTSYRWRRYVMHTALTGGRGFTYIERGSNGQVRSLWPLQPSQVTVLLNGTTLTYRYAPPGRAPVDYSAEEVADLCWMPKDDQVGHYSPIIAHRDVISMAIAATQYGARFLRGGGVPPFAVTGGFASKSSMQRARDDLERAVAEAAKEERQALILPAGLEIKAIGGDPEKAQLVELHRFLIEQVSRIYSLPPTFLQDLTHGTYSNTEQQDLHLVKHTLRRWVEEFEAELNLKLFGFASDGRSVEHNMDGLLRGDFETRMKGHATAIQNGITTPNEARAAEHRAPLPGGDELMMQGATVPIGQLGSAPDGAGVSDVPEV